VVGAIAPTPIHVPMEITTPVATPAANKMILRM
jgi:hypothetical protein